MGKTQSRLGILVALLAILSSCTPSEETARANQSDGSVPGADTSAQDAIQDAAQDASEDSAQDVSADGAGDAPADNPESDASGDGGNGCWQVVGTRMFQTLAAAADGSLVTAGSLEDQVTVGGVTLLGTGDVALFVAKLAGDGGVLWIKRVGVPGSVRSATVGTSGKIALVGTYSGLLDQFGGVVLSEPNSAPSPGSSRGFVALLDQQGGPLWVRGMNASPWGADAGKDNSGLITIKGVANDDLDLGDGQELPKGTSFVARYDPDGALLWSKLAAVGALATLDNGSAVINDGLYFAGLNADGGTEWETLGTESGDPICNGAGAASASFAGSDRAVFAGEYRNPIDLGGGSLVGGCLEKGIFLTQFNSDGSHLWSRGFATSYDWDAPLLDFGTVALATAPNGDAFLAGLFAVPVNFSDDPTADLVPTKQVDEYFDSTGDLFLARFDIDGSHRWSRGFGVQDAIQHPKAMVVQANGRVVLAGGYWVPVPLDLGCGTLEPAADVAGFVLSYPPQFFE